MANTLKFGSGIWATKEDSVLAYNDENGNYKPLPFEFERDTNATVVNKKGLIETVGNNIPRIDFQGNNKGALLLEPERTNLNTYSDPTDAQKVNTSYVSVTYQDNFNWGLGNVINNAIVFGDNSTTRYAYYNSSVTSGTEYTLSAFIKMDDNSVPIPATDFLIVLSGTSFASGYNVESYRNNIYRVSVSGTAGASNTANGILKVASNSSKGFKISAFQVEEGTYPTSYIPTSGGAVTRAADSCSQTPPDGVIGQTEGTVFLDTKMALQSISNYQLFSINNGGSSDRIRILTATDNKLRFIYQLNGGSFVYSFYNPTDYRSLTSLKIAFTYKSGDIKVYINGVLVDSSSNTFTIAETLINIDIASSAGGYSQMFFNDVKLYNTALTDAELQALTQV